MMIFSTTDLAAVCGGVTHGPPGSRSEQYQNLCVGKDARLQYDWMVKHMTPDSSEAPGVKRRVVKAIGDVCGWPVPK